MQLSYLVSEDCEQMILNKAKVDVEDFGDEVVMLELATGAYWSIKGGLIGAARGLMVGGSTEGLTAWAAETSDATGDATGDAAGEVARLLAALDQRGLLQAGEADENAWAEVVAPEGAPVFTLHEELSDLVKLDPIHDVSDAGWPHKAAE